MDANRIRCRGDQAARLQLFAPIRVIRGHTYVEYLSFFENVEHVVQKPFDVMRYEPFVSFVYFVVSWFPGFLVNGG